LYFIIISVLPREHRDDVSGVTSVLRGEEELRPERSRVFFAA